MIPKKAYSLRKRVIAMVDEEYDVTLKGDDIKNSETIADIYNAVVAKLWCRFVN